MEVGAGKAKEEKYRYQVAVVSVPTEETMLGMIALLLLASTKTINRFRVSDHTILWLARLNGWRARRDFGKRPDEPRIYDATPLQTHYFPMPTLERERLTGYRFPTAAFRV